MLQLNKDRVNYGEILIPPSGYVLDQAIATTYSLDLDTLISIPVALYFAQSLDVDYKTDMVQVLESIRRASSSVRVFCQKGQIAPPQNQHKLYSFVEDCIVQVPYSTTYSFHPKVWVLRYKNEEDHLIYRCIVLTRNLTFDRSWDVAFSMDGELQRANNRKTKPLVDFLQWVISHDGGNSASYATFIADLAKVKFDLGDDSLFEDFNFFPIGIDKYPGRDLFDEVYDELLILSPFLSQNAIEQAIQHSTSKLKLFSREVELQKINPAIIGQIDAWHLVNEYVEGESKFDDESNSEAFYQRQDLHAKVYVYKYGWNAEVLIGSANLTNRALYHNIEFMIQLSGKHSKVGTGVLMGELVNSDMAVFKPFHPEEAGVSEVAADLMQMEEEIRLLRSAISNAEIEAVATQSEGLHYRLDIIINCMEIGWSDDYSINAHLYNHETQNLTLQPLQRNQLTIHNCAETDISAFLIWEIVHKQAKVQTRFALKISIANLPATRNNKIFNQIISNSQNFFKYLQFLLADNYWDSKGLDKGPPGFTLGNNSNGYFDFEQPLYEQMLIAISRTPSKLKDIQEVIDKIESEGQEGAAIIPAQFKQLWSIFESVLPKQLKKAAL